MARQEFEQRKDLLLREYLLNNDNEDVNICYNKQLKLHNNDDKK